MARLATVKIAQASCLGFFWILLNCLSRKLDSTSRGAVNSAASTINNFRFFRYCACRKNLNPPYPPFSKRGNFADSFVSPPLKKGDLGGFKNQQTERICGKGYKTRLLRFPAARLALIILWLLAWTGAALAADTAALPARDWNPRQVERLKTPAGGKLTFAVLGDSRSNPAVFDRVLKNMAADPSLSAVHIDVTTTHGSVRLDGPAPDTKSRARAEVLAMAPKGVLAVDNRLVVPPARTPNSAVIALPLLREDFLRLFRH